MENNKDTKYNQDTYNGQLLDRDLLCLDEVLDVDVEDLGAPGNNMPFLRCDELNTDKNEGIGFLK